MIREILFIIALCFANYSSIALAHTKGQFILGGKIIITISAIAPDGTEDTDAIKLYELMNVPPQDSFLGPGKSITTTSRDMSFVCGTKAHNGGPVCTIILNQSSRLKSSPSQKWASYLIQDQEARTIASQWNLTDSVLKFTTLDQKVKIQISETLFQIEFVDSTSEQLPNSIF